ncbi:hypothetical protein BURPS305_5894 [Burkholderia pseudomallei 305]|nr:hypothetical protein BURPS305_5894 [Burkholderia pseudomallei 305]
MLFHVYYWNQFVNINLLILLIFDNTHNNRTLNSLRMAT